MIMLSNLTI